MNNFTEWLSATVGNNFDPSTLLVVISCLCAGVILSCFVVWLAERGQAAIDLMQDARDQSGIDQQIKTMRKAAGPLPMPQYPSAHAVPMRDDKEAS